LSQIQIENHGNGTKLLRLTNQRDDAEDGHATSIKHELDGSAAREEEGDGGRARAEVLLMDSHETTVLI
jgi:hypothetical protein